MVDMVVKVVTVAMVAVVVTADEVSPEAAVELAEGHTPGRTAWPACRTTSRAYPASRRS